MSTVQCQSCKNHVHPRLWHYTPAGGRFRYSKTQHLCNICGNCMYETGGEIRPLGKFLLFFFGAFLISEFAKKLGLGDWFPTFLYVVYKALPILIMLFIIRKIYIFFKPARKHVTNEMPPVSSAVLIDDQTSQPQTSVTNSNALDALERLATLKEKGILTDEEFGLEKKKILQL